MSSQEQWTDVYEIAERMFKTKKAIKHSDMDMFSQIVCARYDTVFEYDPYTEEYSFRLQELTYEEPVRPKVRLISEIDLDALKQNTILNNFDTPSYMNVTPIYGVAPSTLLAFVNGPLPPLLSEAMKSAAAKVSLRPNETDIRPGADFLYRHRDGRIFRVIILQELDVEFTTDEERRYEVAFLDTCQVVVLKLKHLFMPLAELSLEKFPCALKCARFRGIAVIRSGYLKTWNDDIRRMYNENHKVGYNAIVYKTNKEERKMIIDFPSFVGMECTECEYLKTIHGHHSITNKDPNGYTFQQISEKVILPLQYENSQDDDDDDDGSDVELDLNSSGASITPAIKNAECPIGMASINAFLKQSVQTNEVASRGSPQKPVMFGRQRPLCAPPPKNPDYSVNLDISDATSVPSFRSANTTPLPTVDIPERGEITPTKKSAQKSDNHSSDGWGEDTPVKSPKKQSSKNRSDEDDGWDTPQLPTTSTRLQKPIQIIKPMAEVPVIQSAVNSVQLEEHEAPIIQSDPEFSSSEPSPHGFHSNSISSPNDLVGEVIQEEDSFPCSSPGKFDTTVIDQSTTCSQQNKEAPELQIPQKDDPTSLLMSEAQANFNYVSDSEEVDENQLLEEQAARSDFEKMSNAFQSAFSEVDKQRKNANEVLIEVSSVDSVKSICPTDEPELEEEHNTLVDEFASVPEALKKLADSFIAAVQAAASQKNRQSYLTDIFVMEGIASKSSGNLEQRFWKSRIHLAKSLEQSFD